MGGVRAGGRRGSATIPQDGQCRQGPGDPGRAHSAPLSRGLGRGQEPAERGGSGSCSAMAAAPAPVEPLTPRSPGAARAGRLLRLPARLRVCKEPGTAGSAAGSGALLGCPVPRSLAVSRVYTGVSQPGSRLSLQSSSWVFLSVSFSTCCCFFQSCASAREYQV